MTANQRFRSRWSVHRSWAMIAAVAVHVAMFTFSPSWTRASRASPPGAWEGSRLIALPFFGGAPRVADEPLAPVTLVEAEDGTEEEAPVQQAAIVDDRRGDLWDAVGERLRGGGLLVPTLAEPRLEPREETADGYASDDEGSDETSDNRDRDIDGDAALADLAISTLADSLRLDRLSALRPDLAFMAASAWVLIRNPVAVATFMERGYREGTLDPAMAGTVAVTLWINTRGAVEWAEVIESSDRPELDEYALELFNEVVEFRPARERGTAISRSVTLSLRFPW